MIFYISAGKGFEKMHRNDPTTDKNKHHKKNKKNKKRTMKT